MSFKKYLLDKTVQITVSIVGFIIAILMLNAFKVENDLKIALTILFFLVATFNIIFDYFRKYKFYKKILNTLDKLDKKYLILEILNKPNFYDGEIFYQILYDINKSMIENVKEYNLSITDFKEYAEMWIHEVKIPVASLTLLIHNNKNMFDKRYIEQIRKLDNYIDQILYFVRSENAEKDYLIKEIELQKIIKDVALKNNMVCLLHEKPYQGVNGSGKHNNYSLITDTGLNLFDPNKDNLVFLIFLSSLMKGVDEYSDLIRLFSSNPGNDFRLGASEAPPAIVSMYLSDDVEKYFEPTKKPSKKSSFKMQTISSLPMDDSDRNRTSPVAFTGNKF